MDLEQANRQIAERLRSLRRARQWSLDRTARETGVSKAMLGQIERGESSPTVSTLWKIATGFSASLSSFLEPTPSGAIETLIRDSQQLQIQPGGEGMLVSPLFPFEARFGFELFELTLLPGYQRESEAHEAGVSEIVAVVQGKVQLKVDGRWRPLHAGQSMRFAADRPHGYRNLSSRPAVFHNIIHYPARGGLKPPKIADSTS